MASMTNALAAGQDPNAVPPTFNQTLQNYTNSDSPIMQQAAATANRQASRSGLMNSSLAVGAAQGAVTQQAADLAKADISANQNQQSITNQASQYDRSQTEAERAAKTGEGFTQQQITNQNTQFGQSLNEQQRASQAQEGLSQQQIKNQSDQFGMSLREQQFMQQQQISQWNQEFQEKNNQFAQSIQANVKGSYTDAANNLLNNSSVNINNIASNASITKADKDKLIAQELQNRNNDLAYLQSMYSGVNSWASSL